MCQTRISAENASAHSTAELTAITKSCVTSNRLRFSASPTTPAIVPMNSIGKLRATVTRATITVDWVASYVKIPATSSSSQRIALPIPPANHRRR